MLDKITPNINLIFYNYFLLVMQTGNTSEWLFTRKLLISRMMMLKMMMMIVLMIPTIDKTDQ